MIKNANLPVCLQIDFKGNLGTVFQIQTSDFSLLIHIYSFIQNNKVRFFHPKFKITEICFDVQNVTLCASCDGQMINSNSPLSMIQGKMGRKHSVVALPQAA